MCFKVLLALVLAYTCFFAQYCQGQDSQDAELLMRGMDDSRMKLCQGACEISGKLKENGEESLRNFKIVFDYSQNLYRFENVGQGQILYTKENAYSFLGDKDTQSSVTRQLLSENPPPKINVFDVRCFGLIVLSSINQNTKYETIRDQYFDGSRQLVKKEELSNGLTRLDFEKTVIGDPLIPSIQYSYWISGKQGYSCVRKEVYIPTIGLKEIYETSYEEVNHTWVPVSTRFSTTQESGYTASGDFVIDWSSVNEPLPEKIFSLENFSNPDARIVSFDLGPTKPVTVGVVGGTGEKLFKANSERSFFRYILIIIGLGLISIVVIRRVFEWRQNKKAENHTKS
jgi:hypothetical protein